jgi:D-glycero-alpha-D-manno-heptose-7-phosphate kinase
MEVVATAPVRACDVGGWTDTWFAGHGAVFHVAVGPGTTVRAAVTSDGPPVSLDLPDVGDRYGFDPADPPGRHPLLEAACAEAGLPGSLRLRARLTSAVPPGASLGTSASVVVALLGALDALCGRERPLDEVAAAAHRVETERLGLQSGVQDQVAAAHGGAQLVEVDPYPVVRRRPLPAPDGLVVVFLGRSHVSSDVHDRVIASLGGSTEPLEPLREAARRAADAAERGDRAGLGAAMRAANEAQRSLHPSLVGEVADHVGRLADARGALGWKVNGAGGEGGSVSVLCDDPAPLLADVARVGGGVRALDLRPWGGLAVLRAG